MAENGFDVFRTAVPCLQRFKVPGQAQQIKEIVHSATLEHTSFLPSAERCFADFCLAGEFHFSHRPFLSNVTHLCGGLTIRGGDIRLHVLRRLLHLR